MLDEFRKYVGYPNVLLCFLVLFFYVEFVFNQCQNLLNVTLIFFFTHDSKCKANYFWIVIMQVSYMILQRVSPVTHSVGNCVKRVVVIVSSVLFFKTPVSPINSLGKIYIPLRSLLRRSFLFLFVLVLLRLLYNQDVILVISWAGTGIALAGVFLYSRVKRIKPKTKAAWKFSR